jgi:SsrA-binding protein
MAPAKEPVRKLIAENRRARFDYFLEDAVEAGLVLTGTEVKALRNGRANIAESYASAEGRDLVLINAYIPEYEGGNRFNHEPRRHRKLLLHRRQIDRLIAAVQREGRTIVPTKLYWDEKGRAKRARQAPGDGRTRLGAGQGAADEGSRLNPPIGPGQAL